MCTLFKGGGVTLEKTSWRRDWIWGERIRKHDDADKPRDAAMRTNQEIRVAVAQSDPSG